MTDDEVAMLAKHAFDECTVEMLVTSSLPSSLPSRDGGTQHQVRRFEFGDVRVTTARGPLRAASRTAVLEGDNEVRLVRLRGQEMTRDQLSTFYDLLAGLCMDRLVDLRSGR